MVEFIESFAGSPTSISDKQAVMEYKFGIVKLFFVNLGLFHKSLRVIRLMTPVFPEQTTLVPMVKYIGTSNCFVDSISTRAFVPQPLLPAGYYPLPKPSAVNTATSPAVYILYAGLHFLINI